MIDKWLDLTAKFTFEGQTFAIRSVQASDIETLRIWKNANRKFFHFQDEINPEQQKKWFAQFQNDAKKQIYVCSTNEENETNRLIACVGFKEHSRQSVELFNLICGDETYAGKGFIRAFFENVKMGLRAKKIEEIILEVLKSNTRAIEWYKRQGFAQYGEEETFYRMRLKI